MKEFLQIIAEGGRLGEEQAERAMNVMLRGEATPEQVAGLLLGIEACEWRVPGQMRPSWEMTSCARPSPRAVTKRHANC